MSCGKTGTKTPPPQICWRTALRKLRVQLYGFAAQLVQIKVMQRRLITVNVHEER